MSSTAYTGTRANPFNGSPGVAPSPEGEVAFVITDDGARLANFDDLSNYKTVARQKAENSPTSKRGITLERLRGSGVGRVFEGVQGQETYDLVMRDVHYAGIERNFASLRSVYGALIENCSANGGDQIGMPFQIGIFMEQCSDITLRGLRMDNFYGQDAEGRPYGNGDCIATEGNARNILIDTCGGSNPRGDTVFDLKGNPTMIGVNDAAGAHRNYRLWDGLQAANATLISNSPRGQHLWTEGKADATDTVPVITIGKVIATGAIGASSVFRNEDGAAEWTIGDYEISGVSGLLLHANTYGSPIQFTNGGYYTGADGVRRFYSGAPPTGSGGVLL